ncbi:MAG: DNA-methyltransferase [Acidimicrobiales bacterium]
MTKREVPERGAASRRRPTSTSAFGVSRREGHDSSGFYDRFETPRIIEDDSVAECPVKDTVLCADGRRMDSLPDSCIALVVTSPPYFAGKEYEAELGERGVPATYLEYLGMLRDVFAECWRVLEPGGRIAVNVANLGRKPYRSLSADVIRILQDDLGFLLRGEIIWVKGRGANGNCAWGSYASAANPVLRDVTERIVMACKGRFDRVPSRSRRESLGLPYEDTIDAGDFRSWTLDTWHFAPESARRIGHPAPFPVELPRRVIELNTYKGDCVLDPFFGSGQTALACIATGRHYVGVDIDPSYVDLARARVAQLAGSSEAGKTRGKAKVSVNRKPSRLEDKEKRRRRVPSKLAPLPQRARGGTGTDG